MKNHFFAYLLLTVLLYACGASRSAGSTLLSNIPVPAGDPQPLHMPSKKAALTEQQRQSWAHADPVRDTLPGISLDEAYAFLSGKNAVKIKVGIIDSGIDIEHEDIADLVWTNPVDKPGNNLDEDGNLYADDVHGWNFLGGGKGEPVYAQLELTRQYAPLKRRFGDADPSGISDADKEEYNKYLALKQEFEPTANQFRMQYEQFVNTLGAIKKADSELQSKLGKNTYTLEDVNQLPEEDRSPAIVNILNMGSSVAQSLEQVQVAVDLLDDIVNKKYNLGYNGRKTTDNKDDLDDVPYGNPWVRGSGETESHGTHVAGIMLGNRSNGIGVRGVTNDVELIAVRATPNGDEYDKDVALAIRYMADRGAKVVNMSFGKAFSKHPEWVYDAIKYAESKDVLLVKAAGNDGVDLDQKQYFPTDAPDNLNEVVDNVITIGALNPSYDENLIGDYSNYGRNNVDLFAPGTDIYSSVPGDAYDYKQGTSMASPAVAGVAALIRSYYPQLSARQVKHILMNSGIKVDFEVNVPKSNGQKKMPFADYSRTGRILNANRAVRMADRMVSGQ